MSSKLERCYCGIVLLKDRIHNHDEWITLGYYCPICKIQFDLGLMPLISYRAVFHIEPEPRIGIIRELYPPISKEETGKEDPKLWKKIIEKLQPDPTVRTLPEKYRFPDNAIYRFSQKDPEKTFENQVRQDEIKEAAGNQEIKP